MKKTLGPNLRLAAVAGAMTATLIGITLGLAQPARAVEVTQTADPAFAAAVRDISAARVQAGLAAAAGADAKGWRAQRARYHKRARYHMS